MKAILFKHTVAKRILLSAALMLVVATPAWSAQEYRLAVRVVDIDTGKGVPGARVRVDDDEPEVAALGTLLLRLSAGTHRLLASAEGYLDSEIEVAASAGAERGEVVVRLRRIAVIAAIEVVGQGPVSTRAGTEVLTPDDVFDVAGALDNVFRGVQLLPGVATPEDYGGRLAVRGGGPDQNLTILDGVEVHNPYRVFGVVGAFNPETVERFEFTAGGFSARWGDRLSSLLLVDSRRGSTSLAGATAISVTDANVVVEGGLPGAGAGSWLVAARRTYYDLIAGPITGNDFPSFGDLQGRVDLTVGPGRLSAGGMVSRESADIDIEEDDEGDRAAATQDGNNDSAWLRYVVPIGARLSSETVASWYDYSEFLDFDGSFRNEARRSNVPDDSAFENTEVIFTRELYVRDWALRQDFALVVAPRHALDFGFELHSLTSGTRFSTSGDRNEQEGNGSSVQGGAGLPDNLDSRLQGVRAGAWVEDVWQVNDRLQITPGVRLDWSGAVESGTLSPRLAAEYILGTRTRLRAAGGLYTQSPGYEKLLTADYFVDLSDAAGLGIGYQRSWQGLLGAQRELGAGLSLAIEGYYKSFDSLVIGRLETEQERLDRVSRYDFPEDLQSSVPTAPIITSNPSSDGSGSGYGLDVFLVQRPGPGRDVYGWLSYSLGKATQQAYGRDYSFDYDRRHAASAVINWRPARRWELGVAGRWASGFPYTPPIGVRVAAVEDPDWDPADGGQPALIPATDPDGNLVYSVDVGDVSNLNTGQLPHYARLDARLTYRPGGAASRWEAYLEVLNVLNRDNAGSLEASLAYNPNGPEPTIVQQAEQSLPLVPSFGVRFRF